MTNPCECERDPGADGDHAPHCPLSTPFDHPEVMDGYPLSKDERRAVREAACGPRATSGSMLRFAVARLLRDVQPILAAHRSTATHVTEEQVEAAWSAFDNARSVLNGDQDGPMRGWVERAGPPPPKVAEAVRKTYERLFGKTP